MENYPATFSYEMEVSIKEIIQKHLATLGPLITEYGVAREDCGKYNDYRADQRLKKAKAGLDTLLKGE